MIQETHIHRIPSDQELAEFASEEEFLLFCDTEEFIDIARSVLQRFGNHRQAELDREAIRNEALDELKDFLDHAIDGMSQGLSNSDDREKGYLWAVGDIKDALKSTIYDMKSQPAQPSDSQAVSDSEMLDWMINNNGSVEHEDGLFHVVYGTAEAMIPDDFTFGPKAGTHREAIQAAMREQKEGE